MVRARGADPGAPVTQEAPPPHPLG